MTHAISVVLLVGVIGGLCALASIIGQILATRTSKKLFSVDGARSAIDRAGADPAARSAPASQTVLARHVYRVADSPSRWEVSGDGLSWGGLSSGQRQDVDANGCATDDGSLVGTSPDDARPTVSSTDKHHKRCACCGTIGWSLYGGVCRSCYHELTCGGCG